MTTTDDWVRACLLADIPAPTGLRLDWSPPIALFVVDGAVHAVDDTCTHGDFSLAMSDVDDEGYVECLGHMAVFCVRTGRACSLPATVDVGTHDVEVRGDAVYVRIRTPPTALEM